MLPDPRVIPGAVRFTPDELAARHDQIPRDRENHLVLLSDPSEASSAGMRRIGILRERPLLGGFGEWKRLGYPLKRREFFIGGYTLSP